MEKANSDTVPWRYQLAATEFAFKGDYKKALEYWEKVVGTSDKNYTKAQVDSINTEYRVFPAVDYIIGESVKHRVIIINESHINSAHRMFTKSLLKPLYEKGYRNLGMETLTNHVHYKDSLLEERGYPTLVSGYYSKDPQFGDLIRTALEIGFKVFPYEAHPDFREKEREIDQARNIQKMMEKYPDEKFLVYCGHGHVYEGSVNRWEKAMAGRLKEYTNEDPLSINQDYYSEKSNPIYNPPLLKAVDIDQPSVLLDENDQVLNIQRDESWVDIAVLQPTSSYSNNRPDWLFTNGNKSIPITFERVTLDFPIMLLAFKKGEDIHSAIPMDIQEVMNKSETAQLALKIGKYEIVLVNEKNEAVKFDVEVN